MYKDTREPSLVMKMLYVFKMMWVTVMHVVFKTGLKELLKISVDYTSVLFVFLKRPSKIIIFMDVC